MDDSVDTIVSGCSGAGGLDIGFHDGLRRVGRTGRTVAYIEREAFACGVLAQRMEEGRLDAAPIFSDYCQFPAGRFSGLVDWLCAGIPCQGNSLAGKRQLGDDPRNLWPATRRLLRDMGCSGLFLENVYGLLVPDRKGGRCAPIARILGELSEDGFDAAWTTLSSRATGNSQIRERVFVLGLRRGSHLADGTGKCHRQHADGRRIESGEGWANPRPDGSDVAADALCGGTGQQDHERGPAGMGEAQGRRRRSHAPADDAERTVADGGHTGAPCAGRGTQPEGAEHADCFDGESMASDGLADALRAERRPQPQGEGARGERPQLGTVGGSADVADGEMSDWRKEREPSGEGSRRPGLAGSDNGMADSAGNGVQGLRPVGEQVAAVPAPEGLFGRGGGGAIPMPYPRECPPGPADYDAWERVLAVRPDLAPALGRLCEIEGVGMENAAQSAFLRVADALASELDAALRHRAHRLRLCGNGVDPVVASEAFVRLWRELTAR